MPCWANASQSRPRFAPAFSWKRDQTGPSRIEFPAGTPGGERNAPAMECWRVVRRTRTDAYVRKSRLEFPDYQAGGVSRLRTIHPGQLLETLPQVAKQCRILDHLPFYFRASQSSHQPTLSCSIYGLTGLRRTLYPMPLRNPKARICPASLICWPLVNSIPEVSVGLSAFKSLRPPLISHRKA